MTANVGNGKCVPVTLQTEHLRSCRSERVSFGLQGGGEADVEVGIAIIFLEQFHQPTGARRIFSCNEGVEGREAQGLSQPSDGMKSRERLNLGSQAVRNGRTSYNSENGSIPYIRWREEGADLAERAARNQGNEAFGVYHLALEQEPALCGESWADHTHVLRWRNSTSRRSKRGKRGQRSEESPRAPVVRIGSFSFFFSLSRNKQLQYGGSGEWWNKNHTRVAWTTIDKSCALLS